ncbi:MAG: ABC transporter substrate-binding protein [Rhodospirillaceae bacterium]|jgi:branched-chain amino acid transport system substrate-binding protein|nr:ABC transporter substrate-binding protein [Rhodospirillaceae bacterium]
MMKHLFRNSALAAAALAAGLATTTVPAVAADEIVIGLSYGRTGIYSSINKTTEVAVDIAVEEINSAGGINGKQVRIVKFDTAGDPKQAVVAVRKFAKDDKALAVIGPFSSSEARVSFAAGEREKIVQIPNASSAPKMADKFSYAFRMTESEYVQMLRVVKTLKKRNALKKSIAIMYGTDDVVSKAVGLFIMKPIFEKEGVKITGPFGFSLKAFDVAPQVSQLKGKQLDYVGVAVLTNSAIRVLKELRRQGITVPLIGGQIWADPEIVEGFAGLGDNSVFASYFYYDLNDKSRTFSKKFVAAAAKAGIEKLWPHHVDVSAYDTMYVLKAAMEAAKVTGDPSKVVAERTAIRDTLGKLTYDNLVIGDGICFDKFGDAQLPAYIMTMKNKKWELLDQYAPLPCK